MRAALAALFGPATAPGPGAAPGAAPAPARPGGPPGWWRRHRVAVAVVVVFLGLTLLAYALSTRTSSRPLAPDNAEPGGARAAAQILGEQGVRVREATSLAQVGALAGPGTTVLVTDLGLLGEEQRAGLLSTGADLVLVGATFGTLDGFGALTPGGAGSTHPVPARCADPDATAAGEISFTRGSVTAAPAAGAVVCFPVGTAGAGAYAVWHHGDQTLRYLADSRLVTNAHLAEAGNAALTLRMLGHHRDLVWYLPSPLDAGSVDASVPTVPVRAALVGAALVAAVVLLALARGRALGPVVTEVMPVVVRAAETTRGRGRLYRRSRAYDHAAAALRAGTATRLARTLGVPASADAATLQAAVARATHRPPEQVGDLLHGAPPADDRQLLALATALDTLESEVHRS
ncbi:DUF4350 domain-containing protein [Georgenia ruanii]|uniref:DUF4350 domain-containing protein n=1 Tax=Georgenia ruanii TaxID=348442 RepID=UPI0031DC5D2B